MTQEDKDLLLKDLCSRLPYNCKVFYEYVDDLDKKTYGYSLTLNTWCINELRANKAIIKPYLRSMSSMTEEEQEEFVKFHCVNICPMIFTDMLTLGNESKMFDWLNEHHFDYRGLISMGLALEAPEGMYKNKEK